jgi:hypothetical protein
MERLIERLPFDIIINHIIPYTYNVQPKTLLKDIKHYYETKSMLINEKFHIDQIQYEIVAVFYLYEENLHNVLLRNFTYNLKNYHISNHNNNFMYNYSNPAKFNILWGLFTEIERTMFYEHIVRDSFFMVY